jgi:hypothetical protein
VKQTEVGLELCSFLIKPRGKGIIDRKIVMKNRIYVVELEGNINVRFVMDWKAAIVTNSGKHSGNYMYLLRCIKKLRFRPQSVLVCFL